MKEVCIRLGNIVLRFLSLGSRFLLLFFLAKLLEPEEIGLFGLLLATVTYSTLLIGGDFYNYSQRELLSTPKSEWSFILQQQLIAISLLYLLLIPPLQLIFWFEFLPFKFLPYFFALLVVEHLAQELNRLLITLQRPLVAGWVLFTRLGLWVYILLPVLWFYPVDDPLKLTLKFWFSGVLFAVSIGLVIILREISPCVFQHGIDKKWIYRGFKTGFLFLIATLCFRALFVVDRYLVEYVAGPDMLGVYVLYIGIATSLIGFVDAAVLSFLYPRMVRAFRQKQFGEYYRHRRELIYSIIFVSLSTAGLAVLIAPVALGWIGKDIYLEHLPLLWLLLGVTVVYSLSMIPHYDLYARGDDRSILFASTSSLLIFIITTIFTIPLSSLFSVAWGLFAAFAWMGLFKLWRYRKHKLLPPNLNKNRVNK